MSGQLQISLQRAAGPSGGSGKAIYSSSPPPNQIEGALWFDTDTGISSSFYGGKWVSDPTSLTLSSLKEASLLQWCNRIKTQVYAKLEGKVASSTTLPLFSNIGPAYTGSTFVPNNSMWLNDLRSQLTGVHMGAGNYTQSYGVLALSDYYALGVGHNGPQPVPISIKYVSVTGEVHTNTITHWIRGSDVPESNFTGFPIGDVSIYVFANPLPSWVSKQKIIVLPQEKITSFAENLVPLICVSMGNVVNQHSSQNTPNNRVVYVGDYQNAPDAFFPDFYHGRYFGDSGCPSYILIDDILYLDRINTTAFDSIGQYITNINLLLSYASTVSGKPPFTVIGFNDPAHN
jgi:hypothetical protein